METQPTNPLCKRHLEGALKLFLSAFFLTIAGLLFWRAFDPIFDAIEMGLPVIKQAYLFLFMFFINIAGACLCLIYAVMPYFSALFKSIQNKDENNSERSVQTQNSHNNIGAVGFVLSVCCIFIGWIPALGWFLLLISFISCIIGITQKPRWLSIIGLVVTIAALVEVLFFADILDFFQNVWNWFLLQI